MSDKTKRVHADELAALTPAMLDRTTDLKGRERAVLELRSGLHDGTQYTPTEIGRMCNVTSQRIRQQEAQGLRRVRAANRVGGEPEADRAPGEAEVVARVLNDAPAAHPFDHDALLRVADAVIAALDTFRSEQGQSRDDTVTLADRDDETEHEA